MKELIMTTKKNKSTKKTPQIENLEAVLQEVNREFFHVLGLELSKKGNALVLEKPEEQPCFEYGDNVKKEIENVKAVQEMRLVNSKERYKKFGYKVQPVITKPYV